MTRVAFLVNGGVNSPAGYRAREFAARLRESFEITTLYRSNSKVISIFRFLRSLRTFQPQIIYVFELAYSGVIAAFLDRFFSRRVVMIETGDAIFELAKSMGNRNAIALWLTKLLETFSYKASNVIVVRGTFHVELIKQYGTRTEVIPDGVDLAKFTEKDVTELRKKAGLDDVLTVGLVGTSIWSHRLQMCYGWELVELLHRMKNDAIKGILIGEGSGIPHLKKRCEVYGISNKMVFAGQVAFEDLPSYLSLIDVCLNTQTNDVAGRVRTTGKLPLYLATKRFILSANVGEASRLLPPEMLVEYNGVQDPDYPAKLEERIKPFIHNRALLEKRNLIYSIAKEHFDYSVLARKLSDLLSEYGQEHAASEIGNYLRS